MAGVIRGHNADVISHNAPRILDRASRGMHRGVRSACAVGTAGGDVADKDFCSRVTSFVEGLCSVTDALTMLDWNT